MNPNPNKSSGRVSVLILTKNEERDLPGCLATLAWCDDIHVFDSCSTDRTVEIAKSAGATVTQRPFDNWSSHQNWGLKNIPFRHRWVFYIDADERMTSELIDAVQAAVQGQPDEVAYQVQRRDYFMGTWLKHVQASAFYMRLFRPEKVHYERLVNPISIADGKVGLISGFLDHFPFSKGITHWLDRHNSYSTLEAMQIQKNRSSGQGFSFVSALLERDLLKRRFHQKELFYRLPVRPVVKFMILYFGKGGLLDGRAGLTYAALQSIYEYMIVLKTRELQESQNMESMPVL